MANAFRVDLADNGLYRHALVMRDPDEDNELIFLLPEQVEYQPHDGMTVFAVEVAQTLQEICMAHYGATSVRYPWRTAEIVAQFQPSPILDLSVPIQTKRMLYLPSVDWIDAVAYGDTLTEVPDL